MHDKKDLINRSGEKGIPKNTADRTTWRWSK